LDSATGNLAQTAAKEGSDHSIGLRIWKANPYGRVPTNES
jgi:hypothetical protein